ncbi:uncharacterized protein BX663DRAFT_542635 [Cokeromyces recurvatus]|uniref:uncharacterized protein n=1 Tax=Cokeromyces recurvatus TaxID=90255 RepID=UPI00221F8260|nr:uncharacterized protein BX663DRAFT_542635 [Cokeromyces recurvatus]KAI7903767.1 hypothetical protein BX663DRAFT_542635 [Cokeromyces recurvatus]
MNSSPSLTIVSSVLFPYHAEESLVKRRKIGTQTLPGAWIEDSDNKDSTEEEDENSIPTIFDKPHQLTISYQQNNIVTSANAREEDIELLKNTIANLRKEKERLEETNDIVKRNIQIVARKRLLAQSSVNSTKKNKAKTTTTSDNDDDDDDDIYIVVQSDFIPTEEELKAAGLDGWEWISAY